MKTEVVQYRGVLPWFPHYYRKKWGNQRRILRRENLSREQKGGDHKNIWWKIT